MSLDWLAYDAVNTFVSDFGEPLIYTPYGGAPAELQALIYRNPATIVPGLTGSTVYKHEVEIPNSNWRGVTVINRGNDTVAFASKIGGTVETFTVMEIISNDSGLWRLGVG